MSTVCAAPSEGWGSGLCSATGGDPHDPGEGDSYCAAWPPRWGHAGEAPASRPLGWCPLLGLCTGGLSGPVCHSCTAPLHTPMQALLPRPPSAAPRLPCTCAPPWMRPFSVWGPASCVFVFPGFVSVAMLSRAPLHLGTPRLCPSPYGLCAHSSACAQCVLASIPSPALRGSGAVSVRAGPRSAVGGARDALVPALRESVAAGGEGAVLWALCVWRFGRPPDEVTFGEDTGCPGRWQPRAAPESDGRAHGAGGLRPQCRATEGFAVRDPTGPFPLDEITAAVGWRKWVSRASGEGGLHWHCGAAAGGGGGLHILWRWLPGSYHRGR